MQRCEASGMAGSRVSNNGVASLCILTLLSSALMQLGVNLTLIKLSHDHGTSSSNFTDSGSAQEYRFFLQHWK